MLGITNTPSRSALLPAQALRLFDFYMKGARTLDDDSDIVMELCLDADSVLSRIQRPAKKSLSSSTSPPSSASSEDMALRQGVASACYELARLFEQLGHPDVAQGREKKAEKWGYIKQSSNNNSNNDNINNTIKCRVNSTNSRSLTKVAKAAQPMPVHTIATISKDIFNQNIPPTVIRYSLPDADANLNSVHQLVYCLSLLPNAPIPTTDLNDHEDEWRQFISNDQDEQERLHKLVSDVIEMFIDDNAKTETTVAEVISLAPVLDRVQFRTLLMGLVNGIKQNVMLETHLLEGLAQLMQSAPSGYLDSDDLVSILNTLSSRLQGTHGQSTDHLYRLSATVSDVLDAMVNNQVKGLRREQLHEPLAAYLQGLKDSSEPHLVYQAAYGFQALLYIPDDETAMQAMLRRTSDILRGAFGAVSAVKAMDLNAFIGEISSIHKELPYVTDIVATGLQMYTGIASLYTSGATFKQCMEEGLSFSRKSAWYPALRGADALLQTGELIKFKTLVCEAPCRNDAAFQWGLCQRLGQIAGGTQWTMDARQDAIILLGEIYKNDQEWGCHVDIKQWIVHILRKLSSLSLDGLQCTSTLLNELEIDGDLKKQEVYRNCLKGALIQYPFIGTLPPPTSSKLLDRVQKKPGVENSLRQLKRQRMEVGNDQGFYIQLYAKANPQASDDKLFLLMEKVKEFLNSDQKVLLVQGNSGAGKSTFNRTLERTLWETYQKRRGRIPLYINLPAIDKPEKDLVTKQLRDYDFTDTQIKELKMNRSFVLICDGYDESMQTNNLYVANQLNQPGEWKAQMVVSCRSEYLGLDYRDRFQPMDRNHQTDARLFQEAVIVPFSETQIEDYIKHYVAAMDPLWPVEVYQRALKMVPSLQELVKNPFMLSMSLEVLPRMVDPNQDNSNTKVKRVTLYDRFVELWLERGKKRLGETLRPEDRRMFRILSDEGFAQNGIRYLAELAIAIYKHQDGNPVVDYSPFKDKGTWKEEYFSKEDGRNLLREASPLSRTGNQHRFIHRTILEYSLVRAIFEPLPAMSAPTSDRETKAATSTSRRRSVSSAYSFEAVDVKEDEQGVDLVKAGEGSPLVWRSFVDEPSILQFLEDRVRLEPIFKQQLYTYVELSKNDSKWRIAAANAMTILVRAGESFIEADLRDIQIPGADLSYGIFECAQLQGADLRKVVLRNCWLREADLSGANMAGVQFGEWPLLEGGGMVLKGMYSPDGKTLAAVIRDGTYRLSIIMYDTSTWEKLLTLKNRRADDSLIYSPDSRNIASWGGQHEVFIWDTTSGVLIHKLVGHTRQVNCIAYSPSGNHLASASDDNSIRVWDAQSGMFLFMTTGHTSGVRSLAYSPNGLQIATSGGKAIRLWDATSGQQQMVMLMDREFGSRIEQIIYSSDGHEIISRCHEDRWLYVWNVGTGRKMWTLKHDNIVQGVRYSPKGRFAASFASGKAYQWDTQRGKAIHTFGGHSSAIKDLKYSPNGEQIATCSRDTTVRLWDAGSGQLMNIFYGHSNDINCVAYSPNNHQIASFSLYGTIRLWDTRSQQSSHGSQSHSNPIYHVISSPDGRQVASSSYDGIVRVWDTQTGQSIHVLQSNGGRASDIKYSPDGQLLASCHRNSSCVYLWDAQTGQVVHTLGMQGEKADNIYILDFSPTGHQIACGHRYGDVSMWDARTGNLNRILQGHDKLVKCVVFSPDSRQVASYDNSGSIRVWCAQSGDLQYVVKDRTSDNSFIVYTPDSRKIMYNRGNYGNSLQVRDAETGGICYEAQLEGSTGSMAFSPSNQQMAVGFEKGLVVVMDTESGTVVQSLGGHTAWITGMAYSPNGKYIASCSLDRTVRVWDPESGRCLVIIPFTAGYVGTLVWSVSEEGYFLVTGCTDVSVRMWQIVQENDQYQYRLKWSTRQTVLNASKIRIQDVDGLGEANRKLLEQRGAIGEHAPPLTVYNASNQIMTASMGSKPKTAFSQEDRYQDPSAEAILETESLGEGVPLTTLIAPSRLIRDFRFKYSVCSECSFAHVISCRPRD